jgi:hypothetical protein
VVDSVDSADLSSSLFRRGGGNSVRYIICIRFDFVLICGCLCTGVEDDFVLILW